MRQAHSGFQDRHIRPLCHLSRPHPPGATGTDLTIPAGPRSPRAQRPEPTYRRRRGRALCLGIEGLGHCAVSSLLRHVSVMTSETLARAGTRGRPVVLEARAVQGRDMTGCGCPRCSHHRRTGAAQRKRTAEFQRSPLGALTQGPLMSALWTPGRAGASPGSLRHSPESPSRVRPHRPLLDVCAGSRWSWLDAGSALSLAPSRRKSVYSTRVGIHWPRVVRTARRPHLPKVHPTLLQ